MVPRVSTLAEEYAYLDQWYGPGQWHLTARNLQYHQGRAYDVLDIFVKSRRPGWAPERYRIPFDATKIRPLAPAGDPLSPSPSGSWVLPAAILLGAIGFLYAIKRR